MVLHMAHLWKRWSRLTGVSMGASDRENSAALFRDADEMRAFIGAMHVVAEPQAQGIVAAVNQERRRISLMSAALPGHTQLLF